MNRPIYLDYAAATPLAAIAQEAMKPYFHNRFFNPSAVYQSAREVRADIERARADIAHVLGAKDQEIIFTAGGTEANNLIFHGIMEQYPDANCIVSAIEHESVLEPARNYKRRVAPVDHRGLLDIAAIDSLIDENTVLVSIMYANNEIGTIQPLKVVAALIEKKRQQRKSSLPLYLHTDACQAANYLDLSVARLGVDLMTLNGGKIYATKQSGAIYAAAKVKLNPFITGGGQENTIRSGTENVPAIIAFATMLQNVQLNRKNEAARLEAIRDKMIATLSQNINGLTLNGDLKHRLPNNINISIPNADGERLLMELDEAGVMVATGSACTASNDEPSHVLLALGISPSQASSSIRITLGQPLTQVDAEEATKILTTTTNKHIGYTK